MPRIFDNIEKALLPTLRETLQVAERADFCVGYFNLRGWRHLSSYVDKWSGGDGHCCRLLVGMHVTPSDELRHALRVRDDESLLDNQTALREKRRIAEEFRQQLTFGAPTNDDEGALRKLSAQIRTSKLVVKVYLRHPLHAKLYLLHRQDANNPITGFLGSSNLTLAGLAKQGELNVDVLEHDACNKLAKWFEDRWEDRWCVDISKELADIIDESWAGERLVPPYHVYLKMAYHLAQEARAGLSEFGIPSVFGDSLFDFQVAAVKIAAHHLNKRGGVLIGDVVGLGKSMMATALAKVFEDDYHTETLIICPKNLVPMWEDYAHRYRLHAKVLSLSKVIAELPEKTRRYRLVVVDESHNLRNKEGKRWKVIREYIERNDCRTVLLSATPYNKTYLDLSAQLALFLRDDADIGIRPEHLLSQLGGEHEFVRRHQCSVRSLAAFEKSEIPDDWRELMRMYMVRRTRGFIMQHYAKEDARGKYLLFSDGRKSYFPKRIPKNLSFNIDEKNPADPYARFYSDSVVNAINDLILPRYGLGNYIALKPKSPPAPHQIRVIDGLSRAGTRLMGFCRTNLFKRLESAGPAFILSIERHILRNFIVLHALENGLDVPLGTQSAELLDTRHYDEDPDGLLATEDDEDSDPTSTNGLNTEADFRERAAKAYQAYSGPLSSRFKWLPSSLFVKALAKDLLNDTKSLLQVLARCGKWKADADSKLAALIELIKERHPEDKLLVFTQFADTARYLKTQLLAHGIKQVEEATGQSADPTLLAWRFSPVSNDKREIIKKVDELRVLIATDVLSEGQNLQDGHIILNYDLPWAIIRLIQRAGRVDRIGQQADTILCYSFVPADGVERLINLRARVRQRLIQNAEVVGSDETFFDDDADGDLIRDLYTEKNGILDDDGDTEVDLSSYAWQIWKNATDADPTLTSKIEAMPNVVYATKAHESTLTAPCGALVYMRTTQGNDALAWIDESGQPVTQSQLTILKAAACSADTPARPRSENHHTLTLAGLAHIAEEEKTFGGALGRPSGARFKTFERIKRFRESQGEKRDLFITDDYVKRIDRVLEEIYRYPLYQSATDTLNRQLKAGIGDHTLIEMVFALREDGRFCMIDDQEQQREPKLICSMGLV
ncbi:helicase-related protein [Paraburkholderia metrosideri]|uniref:RNA polymerase-associated protein RapA n=1 Tax=Paraburkholderia metrosideri TaxID=580937 RepID=A0ABN7IDS1_9BURK|nr:helicase-related protein [Paraburkholderia metrosideri]CAD6557077.1 RNA polymerase-associated protein RapA [Paraburkholderia metrosideri]